MLASEQTLSELALPELELRAVARRVALPGLIAGGAIAAAVLGAGHVHAFADAVRRVLGLNAGWALAGAGFEFVSLAGYVILLALVAGRTTPRIGTRESAQITLAGAAATRLLPTAGAGGAVVALWSLGRAGLRPQAAARTLLTFLVALYSVFLTAIVVSGIAVMVALGGSHGPVTLSVIPAVAALGAITLGVGLGFHRGRTSDE